MSSQDSTPWRRVRGKPPKAPKTREPVVAVSKGKQVGGKRKNPVVDTDQSQYLFECPICMESFKSKVYQCDEGHLLCGSCILTVNECPTCNLSLAKKIRNRAVEQLAPVFNHQCPNRHLGCAVKCKEFEMGTHIQMDCHFEPRPFCKMLQMKCEETVRLSELWKHLKEQHRIVGCDGNEVILRPESGITASSGLKGKLTKEALLVLMRAFDHIFIVSSRVDIVDRSVSFMVRVIGNVTTKRFSYDINLEPPSSKEHNNYTSSYNGEVLGYTGEDPTNASFPSIPLSKLNSMVEASFTIKVSIKPIDDLGGGSKPEVAGIPSVPCSWNRSIFSGAAALPLASKTPNRQVTRTMRPRKVTSSRAPVYLVE